MRALGDRVVHYAGQGIDAYLSVAIRLTDTSELLTAGWYRN